MIFHSKSLLISVKGGTSWKDYTPPIGMYTDIDMSKCEFVAPPNVVTSLNGLASHWQAKGEQRKMIES